MMKCDDCNAVAQWVMLWVTRHKETPEEKAAREKAKLMPIGPTFEVAGRFCGRHKQELEKIPCDRERVFRFAGAVVGF